MCALCQATHFVGHNGEPATLFTCARCFNCRIKCKQVCLPRNIFDYVQNQTNGFALIGQVLNDLYCFLYSFSQLLGAGGLAVDELGASGGFTVDLFCAAGSGCCAAGDLLCRRGHFVHGGGDLFDHSPLAVHRRIGFTGDFFRLPGLSFD
ncbi:hypothetical protein D9M69_648810 [compost metagenome]